MMIFDLLFLICHSWKIISNENFVFIVNPKMGIQTLIDIWLQIIVNKAILEAFRDLFVSNFTWHWFGWITWQQRHSLSPSRIFLNEIFQFWSNATLTHHWHIYYPASDLIVKGFFPHWLHTHIAISQFRTIFFLLIVGYFCKRWKNKNKKKLNVTRRHKSIAQQNSKTIAILCAYEKEGKRKKKKKKNSISSQFAPVYG